MQVGTSSQNNSEHIWHFIYANRLVSRLYVLFSLSRFLVMTNVSSAVFTRCVAAGCWSPDSEGHSYASGLLHFRTQQKLVAIFSSFFSAPSLAPCCWSAKAISFRLWKCGSQTKGQVHGYTLDSSLIRKFPHEYSCTSRPLSPSVTVIAALHKKEGSDVQLTVPLSPFKMQ